jgi:superfamily II DNA helicase RecQ
MSRDNFEEVLGAMARVELLTFADAVFEKGGKQIPYRTVSLTAAGRAFDESTPTLFMIKDAGEPVPARKRKKAKKPEPHSKAAARTRPGPAKTNSAIPESERQGHVEQALRSWRLNEAKRRNVPAFRIFGDRTLRSLAAACPKTDAELLAVPGIGLSIVQKYGAQIYRLIENSEL